MPADFVLIRGLGREAIHWGGFDDKLLAKDYCQAAHCLDLPGFGRFHKLTAPLTIEENASFAITQLPDKRDFVLVAISLGGMVAIEMARQAPSRFQKIYVINSSFANLSPVQHRLQMKAWRHLIRIAQRKDPVDREIEILRMVSQNQTRWAELSESFGKAYHQRPARAGNIVRQLLAAARYKIPKAPLDSPVVVINSLGDQMVSPQCSVQFSEYWSLPLHTHPTAGHDVTIDDPDWVINVISQTL